MEKAAIMRPGRPAVLGPGTAPVTEVLEREADRIGAPLIRAIERVIVEAEPGRDWDQSGTAVVPGGSGEGASEFTWCLPLAGTHMLHNLATALTVVSLLVDEGVKVPERAIIDGIGLVQWPGRLHHVPGGPHRPDLLLEVGHNPLAARVVARELETRAGDRPIGLVLALGEDKDLEGVLEPLIGICSRFTATRWPGPRGRDPVEIESVFRSLVPPMDREIPTAVEEDPVEAVRRTATTIDPAGIVVALGSHLLVGPLLEVLDLAGVDHLLPR
jgi:dihydrofolate synthase/folylpolyglutamate synthase